MIQQVPSRNFRYNTQEAISHNGECSMGKIAVLFLLFQSTVGLAKSILTIQCDVRQQYENGHSQLRPSITFDADKDFKSLEVGNFYGNQVVVEATRATPKQGVTIPVLSGVCVKGSVANFCAPSAVTLFPKNKKQASSSWTDISCKLVAGISN